MKKWGIYFCYGGLKHLLFDLQATSVDFENEFKNLTLIGNVKEGYFYPDELLISKIITLLASSDRKNVNINTDLQSAFVRSKDQDIFAKVWVELV
ncbi:MAG TPA: hypothetical protein PKD85_00995 [Saprospiraceae bacterium]|nr:hypothetical protein [Saprospiraceae bacterium]